MSVRRAAAAAGSYAAARLHGELRLNPSIPVDVFDVVQRQRIWLKPGPLGQGQYGFYLRQGDTAGIFLNSNHPETTQRFTCAHELGHHMLGHASHVDGEAAFSPDAQADELAAQTFASNFLMPYAALQRAMRSVGVDQAAGAIESGAVYAASLKLDVSYRALVWHLRASKWISYDRARALTRAGALPAAKRSLAPADISVPSAPRVDVRSVMLPRDDIVTCRVGDDVLVHLQENPATGHRWELGSVPQGFSVLGSAYAQDARADENFGADPVWRIMHLRADDVGHHNVSLVNREAWGAPSALEDELHLRIDARPRQIAQDLFENQGDRRIQQLAA